MSFQFQSFPISSDRPIKDPWDTLLQANGGPSAEWITNASGNGHETFVCCLLTVDAPAKKRRREDTVVLPEDAPWAAEYDRIAILVPVAVRDGIALAQGIRRLYETCPTPGKGLGLQLLARVAEHFRIEYLFLSPIYPFADHVKRQLYVSGVPYGRYGYRSLGSFLRETMMAGAAKTSWLNIKETSLLHTRKDKFLRSDIVLLTITPQPCPKRFVTYNCELKQQEEIAVPSYIDTPSPPRPRILLLNERFCPTPDGCDPGYRPPPAVRGFPAFDFLWHMAGNGLLVVHGPSLAAAFAQ